MFDQKKPLLGVNDYKVDVDVMVYADVYFYITTVTFI